MRDGSSVCEEHFSMVDELLQLKSTCHCYLLRIIYTASFSEALASLHQAMSKYRCDLAFLAAFFDNERQRQALADRRLMVVCLSVSVVPGVPGIVTLLVFLLTS